MNESQSGDWKGETRTTHIHLPPFTFFDSFCSLSFVCFDLFLFYVHLFSCVYVASELRLVTFYCSISLCQNIFNTDILVSFARCSVFLNRRLQFLFVLLALFPCCTLWFSLLVLLSYPMLSSPLSACGQRTPYFSSSRPSISLC